MLRIATILLLLNLGCALAQPDNFLKARALDLRGLSDSALLHYSLHIEKNPRDVIALVARGNLYAKIKNSPLAIADFNEAEKYRNGMASYNLACAYALLKDTVLTLRYLERHLSSIYRLPASEIRTEPAFDFLKRSPQWLKLWGKQWYTKLDELLGEARYIASSADWMGVINFVDENTKGASSNTALLAIRAKAYMEMGNARMAVSDFNKAIDNAKRNPEYYMHRADAYFSLNNYNAAETDYSKAIALQPDNFNLYFKRGQCYSNMGLHVKAVADATMLAALFPDNKDYLYFNAEVSYYAGMYLQSLQAINKLFEQMVPQAKHYFLRAKVYEATKMFQQAEANYDSCLNTDPLHTGALKARGLLRQKNKNQKGACADWLKAEEAGDLDAGRLRFENCR